MSQPTTISLGLAASFGALSYATVTNTATNSVVTGDIGVYPGTAVTGFGPGALTGNIYAQSVTGGLTPVLETIIPSTAIANAGTAYTDGAGRTVGNGAVASGVYTAATLSPIPGANISGQDLGTMTLPGGVYKFNTTAALTGTLTLDWASDNTSVWIFIVGTSLIFNGGSNIIMTNLPGSPPSHIPVFWIVGTSATLGLNSSSIGTIIASAAITANSGAIANSLIGLTEGVTLDNNAITSYSSSTATGGDPHIIALDGSRLDVYEPGFYRMFDSNEYDNRMIVNT